MKTLPIAYLHECFDLDSETGVLRWKVRPRSHFNFNRIWLSTNTKRAGKVAGILRTDGYLDVVIAGRCFLAHRIVYAMTHGEWTPSIDHDNGKRADNRPINLIAKTHADNMKNRRFAKGTHFQKARLKWTASITRNYKQKHLGTFETEAAARAAYLAAVAEDAAT